MNSVEELIYISYTNFYFYIWVAALFLLFLVIQKLSKDSKKANSIKKFILLCFSFFIIATYDLRFCICILFASTITYVSGILIDRFQEKQKRIEVASVIVLCLFLGVFKYTNYIFDFISARWEHEIFNFRLLFPVGISFYVFSAIGYIIDLTNKRISVEKNFLDMLLFLSFFPKIVCGPIARAREFLPQLKTEQKIKFKNFETGIQILVIGLFKKMVIADHLAVFVNEVYGKPAVFNTVTIWLAAFTYFIQMYFDFSGYSDMAIGVSKVFGYELPMNFNLPYLAHNISDFWSRWHISLTSWLTEYVFNPVAFSLRRKTSHFSKENKKRFRTYFTYIAIIVTFLVSGIWHGVGMTFVVWGLCHGIISVLHAMYATWIKKKHPDFVNHKPRWVIAVDVASNLFVVIMLEALFRAETFSEGIDFFSFMFSIHGGLNHIYSWVFVAVAIMILSAVIAKIHQKKLDLDQIECYYPLQKLETVKGLSIFFIFAGLTVILAYVGKTYFLYGNF